MKYLIRIILSTCFLFSSITWANDPLNKATTPDPNCPLDYFYLGYDLIKGNPATDTADPGWRLAIMEQNAKDTCLTCTATTTCAAQYRVYDMDAELDYHYSLSQKASLSGSSEDFFKSSSFTGSAEYYYQQEDVFGLGLVNVQAEGACQLFQGGRDLHCYDVNFSVGFANTVSDFPTSMNDPDWFEAVLDFFNYYGTHLVTNSMSLGARWSYQSLFTQVSYDALRAGNVNIQMAAEASAEYFRTKGGSAAFESEEVTEMRVAFDGSVEQQSTIFIGAPPPVDLSFSAWANNIENPIPQKYQLSPISELFTSRFFPNDPNIDAKRAVLEAGYLMYIPKPPKIVHVHDSEDGKYQTKNSLTVSCPTDYQLISGGCNSEHLTTTGWWMFSSLKPIENTFHCLTHIDYYTDPNYQHYYLGLDTTATCLHDDYIKDRVIVSCTGATGKDTSDCLAQCPVGFDVTGGGCESNLPTETRPWKVIHSTPIYNSDAQWSGWGCKVGEDHTTGVYNRNAHGYAICVQYADGVLNDKKIVTERSGTAEKWTNSVVAACDTGYEVLSGGCVLPTPATHEWKTVESQPISGKEWSCIAQEDMGSGTYHQDVQVDALCVKFN